MIWRQKQEKMDLIKKNTGETRTSLALTVRTRASKSGSTFKEAAFKVAKTLENLASKGSLNLNKEAAFTLSNSEPGPHELKISNFRGEVGWFNIQSNTCCFKRNCNSFCKLLCQLLEY